VERYDDGFLIYQNIEKKLYDIIKLHDLLYQPKSRFHGDFTMGIFVS